MARPDTKQSQMARQVKNKITNSKLEVRMSKIHKHQSEIRNPKQIQIVKNLTTAMFQTKPLRIPVLDFGVLGFIWLQFFSDFDIRISDLRYSSVILSR